MELREQVKLKNDSQWCNVGLVVVLVAMLCLPWLTRPFHTRGEPREALVAQAMLRTGNWISPPAYDGAVPSKPPFSHWLIALMSSPQGVVSEATSRLPSALAVIIFTSGFLVFLSRRTSSTTALGASLVLLASSEWFRGASTCRVDTILAASMSGALLALFAWWERRFRGIPVLAIVLISIAALTKGPIGIVLPVGIFSLFCWAKSGFNYKSIPSISLRGIAITIPALVSASVWYLLGYFERGNDFIQKIMYENFDRFTSSMVDEPHKHSIFYLLGMLALGLVPWSFLGMLFGVGRLKALGAANYRKNKGKEGAKTKPFELLSQGWRSLDPIYQYSWIIASATIIFFSIPSSKRSVYLLPAYPFIALILERFLRRIELTHRRLFSYLTGIVVAGVGLILLSALMLMIRPIGGVRLSWDSFVLSLSSLKVLTTLCILIALFGPLKKTIKSAWSSQLERLAIAIISAVFVVSFFVYDTVAWQLSPKPWINSPDFQSKIRASTQANLYSYGTEMYGASFYLARPFSRALPGNLPVDSLVFVEAKRIENLQKDFLVKFQEIYRYHSDVESSKKDVVVMRVLP